MAYILFQFLKFCILRRPNSAALSIWLLPVLLLFTLFINMFFILYKASHTVLSTSSTTALAS